VANFPPRGKNWPKDSNINRKIWPGVSVIIIKFAHICDFLEKQCHDFCLNKLMAFVPKSEIFLPRQIKGALKIGKDNFLNIIGTVSVCLMTVSLTMFCLTMFCLKVHKQWFA
jgi:hypothetical protein